MSELWYTPKPDASEPETRQRQADAYLLTLPPFGLQPNGDMICRGCRHDLPANADCRRRTYGGGFPEGDCWEAP